MEVTVHFTTQLRAALGTDKLTVPLDAPCSVKSLIGRLATEHPEAFSRFVVDDQGGLLPNVIVCVGDTQVADPDNVLVGDGDDVTLLSAISGG